MGNSRSREKKGSREKKQASDENNEEEVELILLRKTIQRNPESFVLNNLMLCVQFFENYE